MTSKTTTTGPHLASVSEPPPNDAEARVNGVYDLVSPRRLAGWAIDRADPEASVAVEVYRVGELLTRTRADRHRPDLERGGIGSGLYGFVVDLDTAVEPGMAFALTVRAVTGDGVSGRLRPTGKALPSSDPSRHLQERMFEQVNELRLELAELRCDVAEKTTAPDTNALAETLSRIEVTQARLDVAAAHAETLSVSAESSGLRILVWSALTLSALALALGIWSLLVG